MSYKSARGYVPMKRRSTPVTWPTYDNLLVIQRPLRPVQILDCSAYRQGDEMACACGKRWPVGESHP